MLALEGYYDGKTIQPLEKMTAKKNQKLIITILDEFMQEIPDKEHMRTARGSLARYANPDLLEQESSAWERAAVERKDGQKNI